MRQEDLSVLEELIDTAVSLDLSEAEIEAGDLKLAVVRKRTGQVRQPTALCEPSSETTAEEPLAVIRAPMVGYFKALEPPITVGSQINPGDIVCSILSLGLTNEVHAAEGGIVCEVHVQDGEAVEYGKPLFTLQPVGASHGENPGS